MRKKQQPPVGSTSSVTVQSAASPPQSSPPLPAFIPAAAQPTVVQCNSLQQSYIVSKEVSSEIFLSFIFYDFPFIFFIIGIKKGFHGKRGDFMVKGKDSREKGRVTRKKGKDSIERWRIT